MVQQIDPINSAREAAETLRLRMAFARQQVAYRSAQENLEAIAAKHKTLSGEFMLNGTGEAICDLMFPDGVRFTEKPLMSFGGEVRNWASLTESTAGAGNYPSISVVIVGWMTKPRPPESLLYEGVRLAVVTDGDYRQKMFVHWHVEGMSLGGPVDYQPIPLVGGG